MNLPKQQVPLDMSDGPSCPAQAGGLLPDPAVNSVKTAANTSLSNGGHKERLDDVGFFLN